MCLITAISQPVKRVKVSSFGCVYLQGIESVYYSKTVFYIIQGVAFYVNPLQTHITFEVVGRMKCGFHQSSNFLHIFFSSRVFFITSGLTENNINYVVLNRRPCIYLDIQKVSFSFQKI